MKDFMMIWTRIAGRRYSAVQRNASSSNSSDSEDNMTVSQNPGSFRRKSSAMVNRFFNTTLPVHVDGRPRWPKRIFTLMTLAVIGFATASFIILADPYNILFRIKLILTNGGETFEIWRRPNVDLYLKVYLFNITNHDEYLSGRESRLRFQEIGPYVYKENIQHGIVEFNDNGTITATPLHPLTYMPEMSNGAESDMLILPNIAMLSFADVMRDSLLFTRLGVNMLIRQTDSHPLVPMTAREFMFGYETPLVKLANNLMPAWIKFDKLGLIDRMYDFRGEYETVYTGETDIHKGGLIEKYNGDVNLPQWTGKCANVNGASDGSKFPSFLKPNDTILFFRKSLCRSAKMVHVGEDTINGLDAYRYQFAENELDNGAYNPENKCFCRRGVCLKPGLIDVTDCYYGFPIALSYPHFYKADPSILASVDGLNPRADLHESFVHVQPASGLPLHVAFRFQINMALHNIRHMARVEKFDNATLPLLWFEIVMEELPPGMSWRYWFYLKFLPYAQETLKYVSLISGVIFLSWSVLKILLHQPTGNTVVSRWFEFEMNKKKMQFMHDKHVTAKTKEIENHCSSLLASKEPASLTTAMHTLKHETV